MLIKIAATSREKIGVRVRGTDDAGELVNPTTDTVEFAFTSGREIEPDSGDWVSGSWVTFQPARTVPPIYRATCLVGPGGNIELAAGRYWIWVRITDNPEVPVLSAGELQVGEVGI